MIKQSLVFCLACISILPVLGQLTLLPISSKDTKQQVKDVTSTESTQTPLILPFWDDFSYGGTVPDTNRWLIGADIWVTNDLAINAPTQFVASFDGTNALGRPYQPGNIDFNGLGDVLQSRSIDLTRVPIVRRNTVFLSFYYQLRGYGNLPDAQDSLQLQFLDINEEWITQNINRDDPQQLALTGGLEALRLDTDGRPTFRQIIVQISNPIYFHAGFSFRFRSFSSQAGIYDNWLLDYIYLNQDRNARDTLHFDRSIAGPQSGVLSPYRSMPLHQYLVNPVKYSSPALVTVSNLDNTFHPLTYSHTLTEVYSGNSITLPFQVDERLNPYERSRLISGLSADQLSLSGDSAMIHSTFIYHTGDKQLFEVVGSNGDTLFLPVNLATNDTIISQFELTDYYALDDGTAEFAAGINLLGGKLAVAYYVEAPDTLTEVLFHFPAIEPTSIGQTIDVIVWANLATNEGAQITRISHIISATNRNEFQRVIIDPPVIVQDTFFVGFEQFTNNYIGVGFDRNSPAGTTAIYTNTNRRWDQNRRLAGSLMIRPVFGIAPEFILSIENSTPSITVYPNPATDKIYFSSSVSWAQIIDLGGKVIYHRTGILTEIDIQGIKRGVYICKFGTANTPEYQQQTLLIRP